MSNIEIKDLHFYYDKEDEILKGINLNFDKKATAIIGQNGAGKTTFVKLLKGLLKPQSGNIIINGVNTKTLSAAKLSKYIGMVFQNPDDQIFKNKVIDEVMFGPLNIGQSKEEAEESAKIALEEVGILEEINKNPYDLSLAERKLISIASVIAMNTEIIIFDEPTIAQDYEGKQRIKKIINNLKEKDKLVITIIHDMDFVAETFERTIVFAEGEVLLDGTTREVFSNKEVLEKAYLELPHVTELCNRLGLNETFLSVEEFLEKGDMIYGKNN